MADFNAGTEVRAGSNVTVALRAASSTTASPTPGIAFNTRVTLATQPPHVMPSTFNVTVSIAFPLSNQSEARQRLSSRALVTTDTELAAIAAPAITGFNMPSAANGMPSTLYANAKNRFWWILANVARDKRIASTTALRSLRTTVMSAASIAT